MRNALLESRMEPVLVALGQFIRERRTFLNMSQEELAKAAGLHRTYVSDVERGNRNITIGATRLLAQGLGLRMRDLILAIDNEPELDETARIQSSKFAFEHERFQVFPERIKALAGFSVEA